MTNWKKYKLGDIVTLNYGKSLTTNTRLHGSIPVFSSSGITGNHNQALVESASVIVGRKGTVGSVFYTEGPFYCIDTAYYILPQKEYDLRFLFYMLQTIGLEYLNEDSAVPGLNRNTAYSQDVLLPDLPTQTHIASILSSLDDKIELNRRTNHTLEQIAQTLFKKYFVTDIDPNNLPYGWRWGTLGDVISVKHGFAFQGKYFVDEPNHNLLLTPGNFKIGGGFNYNKFKYFNGLFPEDYILEKNDLIVTMTDLSKEGDTLGFSALTPHIPGKKLLHNQRIGKVLFKIKSDLKYYVNWLMRSDDYRAFILGSATGSTVKHTSPTRICEYPCLIPNGKLVQEFNSVISPLSEMEMDMQNENSTLTKTRDSLLPKLMTGEIAVN